MSGKKANISHLNSFIGERQLLVFKHSKEEKIKGKYGWHFCGESVKLGDFLRIKGTHQMTVNKWRLVSNATFLCMLTTENYLYGNIS